MPLYQPTNVTPSQLNGTGTVDASQGMTVSWQVNGTGNTPMVAYQIDIMMNNAASTALYSTGKVSISPFYGADAAGSPVTFSVNISSANMTGSGIVNSASNEYKLQITQWWSASESIVQRSASVFICRKAPVIAITNYQSIVFKPDYAFSGFYSQEQGDPIGYARWQLRSGDATMADTGDMYSVGPLRLRYDGFLNNGTVYEIRLSGATVNGVAFDTGWKSFTAQYTTRALSGGTISACPLCHTDAIEVSVTAGSAFLFGETEGAWQIVAAESRNWLYLPGGASVSWGTADAPMGFAPPYRATYSTRGTTAPYYYHESDVVMRIGDQEVHYGWSYYPENGDDTGLINFEIAMECDGVTATATVTYYFNNRTETRTFNAAPGNLNMIKLVGNMTCGTISVTNLDSGRDYMTVDYADGLSPVYWMEGHEEPPKYAWNLKMYKRVNGGAFLTPVQMANPSDSMTFRDYAVTNGNTYAYYLMSGDSVQPEDQNTMQSNEVSLTAWNWDLLLCDTDANGNYLVQAEYRFALEVSSGTVSNNSKPTMQANFTPYPLRQPTTQCYRSGTLTAYIGKAVNGQFADSLDEITAIREISTSTLTKFLKTRKGELLMVDTSDPITMAVGDKYAAQPVRVGIPWAEVGDATDAAVFAVSTGYWPAS